MSNKPFVLSIVSIMFIFILCFPPGLPAQEKPVLHGTVYLKLTTGLRPLDQAKIELREVVVKNDQTEAGKLLFKTYSDSKGNFAFYGIPQGKYLVAVVRGKTVYTQLHEEEKSEVWPVTVPDPLPVEGIEITIITVLGHS